MTIDATYAAQTERINRERARTGVSEVRLHHVPNRYRLRFMKRFGTGGVGNLSGSEALGNALHYCRDAARWFDHWGSTLINGSQVLVSEPYAQKDSFPELEDFINRAGMEMLVLPDSWWNPPSTVRIAFFLLPETA